MSLENLTVRQLVGRARGHERRGRLLRAQKLLRVALEKCENGERAGVEKTLHRLNGQIILKSAMREPIS